MDLFNRYRDLILPVGIIACLAVILIPLPPGMMDVLLAANITVGVVVLLTSIRVGSPLEFSVFPSLLLATTLARLVLNIATTRLILTSGESSGLDAAGGVIRGFGEFVAGDQIEVGLVIFAILIAVQFLVITKGATRISEVAARFALDGMPGRQMAIDADVNAGLIDEHEARQRREEIRQQADFYGAMDGASKFVRGDAVASIVITVVNIIGGLYVGLVHAGMPISEAGAVFTKLTIGDGLVSQIPALLISLAAGLLVTRSASRTNLPVQFLNQVFGDSKSLAIAGVFLLLLMVTNLPAIPLLVMGAGCIGLSYTLQRKADDDAATAQIKQDERERAENAPKPKPVEDYLIVDPLEVSIGIGLISLADPSQGGDLMQRIGQLRNEIATELGLVLPKVRVRDDSSMETDTFEIRLSGSKVLAANLHVDRCLAVDNGATTGELDGLAADDISAGAMWIDPDDRQQAEIYGYVVRQPSDVLIDRVRQVVSFYAPELLTRDGTNGLLDRLRETSPTLVDEMVPDVMSVSEVQQVLRLLLKERVSIRQLALILEAVSDARSKTSDPYQLCAAARRILGRTICANLVDSEGVLNVVTLDPEFEQTLLKNARERETEEISTFFPEAADLACERIQEAVKKMMSAGFPPCLLVNPRVRWELRQWTESSLPWLNVISFDELVRETQVHSHEMIALETPTIATTESTIAA